MLGQYAKAIELHELHRSIAEEVGDRVGLGKACGNLGSCYGSLGQYAKAIELHEQDRSFAEEVGDRAGQGGACSNLGNCYSSLGQYAKAIELHEQDRAIGEEVGDRAGQRLACGSLGNCYSWLGQYAKAIKHYKKCWDLSEQVGNASHQARAALTLGVALWTQGLAEHQATSAADGGLQMQKQIAERIEEARQWLKTALDRNTVLPVIATELDATLNLSYLAFLTSQEAEALKYLHAHLDLCVKHARDSCASCVTVS
jgi:tetratricopeptide (TPR) repeat protein